MTAALLLLALQYAGRLGSPQLILEVRGVEGQTLSTPLSILPASDGSSWHFQGPAGGIKLSYQPGKGVYVEEASCPDQVCVKTGLIDEAGQAIVCAPNQIIVRLSALREPAGGGEELDGVLK
jgi:hypothetical protein